MSIKNQREYFDKTYDSWREASDEKIRIINETLNMLGIEEGSSLLDVASGTGILYSVLKDMSLSNYVALDISENMLKELKSLYPETTVLCGDFDKEIELKNSFDYIIIFNSIPHFENLDTVFSNADKHLKAGGTFAIVHARTREGLKQHHRNIGYNIGRDAIPDNKTLNNLVNIHKFKDCIVKDEEFFYFFCKK